RAGTADYADTTLARDVTGHDADLELVGRNETGAVGAQQQGLLVFSAHAVAHHQHVTDGDAFRDADDQVQVGVDRFPDGVSCACGRHVDDGDRRPGFGLRFLDGGIDRHTFEVLAGLLGVHACDERFLTVGVLAAVMGMELARFAGHSLRDDFGVFVDQDRHLKILGKFLFGSSDNFLRGFGHGIGADDGQARVGQQLLAQLFVGALHAHDQRYAQVDGLARGDHAFGNDVATHDAAKDVDEDRLHTLVLQHDLEGFGDLLGRGATADVQEVGGLTAEQLDGVHGCHGQAGTVHQAADIAVQLDVGQIELAGFDFSGVFFVQIAIFHDVGVAEQGIGIEVELGVQCNDIALAIAVQRVDFDQRGVGFHIALIQLLENVYGLIHGIGRHFNSLSDLRGLFLGETHQRIDVFRDDFLGGGLGHFLDVHAAFAGSDERNLLRCAVGHDGYVVFLLDVGAFLDVEAADLLAFRAGLVRHELHAEDLGSQLTDFIDGASQLDAAALPTTTSMDLSLDDPDRSTQFLGRCHGFVDGKGGDSAGHSHAKFLQQFLALILVNFH